MKVLVTGGAGYVGSHCVKQLLEQRHEVVVYDNLSGGHRGAIDDGAEFVRGDLQDRIRLKQVFDKYQFDGVMHFAALLNVNESIAEPQRYYANNVNGSMNLIGEMLRTGVRRLVFSSTCAIYGEPARLPITEDLPKEPITPYGRTKWIVEMALQDCALNGKFGSVALRYFNASGAALDGTLGEDRDPEYHLIPVVLQVALGQREQITVMGDDYPTPDGTAVRDYIHVEDLARAHLLALDSVRESEARAYNVGTGSGTSVLEVVESARRVTGHPIPAPHGPRREGDPPQLYADPQLIMSELQWAPQVTRIDDIVASAWAWHKAHPNGYED